MAFVDIRIQLELEGSLSFRKKCDISIRDIRALSCSH